VFKKKLKKVLATEEIFGMSRVLCFFFLRLFVELFKFLQTNYQPRSL